MGDGVGLGKSLHVGDGAGLGEKMKRCFLEAS